ncbi:MAG: pyruvate dehydrogenase (acetyl-transferring) E1 component subunit alpha [Chlamydiales bacterium]|nr:pyruvate dehydrogenase (acetyl-transferring) E1 component subunit alpha [Chlamydiales bacterium]
MAASDRRSGYQFFQSDERQVIDQLGAGRLHTALEQMLLIRNFERRAESAYQQGKIGGFFHSYMGQEAIQTAAVMAMGLENWWITSYRCHALALLLGATPNELMAELYGRETGNAKGRGGSMHFFTDRLLGGFGIVGGQVPIAVGAAFTSKYLGKKGEVAVCFMGDGAVAQGAFHEALNLASLWDLPCIFVIENNLWGMGTAVNRALAVERIAEEKAPGYKMKAYTFDGTDFLGCYAGFKHVYDEVVATERPVLIEAIAERFRGHSISDPGLYRTKEKLQLAMQGDPIEKLTHVLYEQNIIDESAFHALDQKQRDLVVASMQFAEESPWPNPITLEEGVYAP